MIIISGSPEWNRIENEMNEKRDCSDYLHLFDVIRFYESIYHVSLMWYDSEIGEYAVDSQDAKKAASLYTDIYS